MKYLNLIYSKTPVGKNDDEMTSHYESTTFYSITDEQLQSLGKDDIKVLTYTLRSNETVDKWVTHYLNTQNALTEKFGYRHWGYNYYTTPSWDLIYKSRVKMNSIIDYINTKKWFTISEDLKLEVDNKDIIEESKLNELHFIFENQSFDTINHEERKEIFYYLEAINNLVHLCERYRPGITPQSEFHSYRLRDSLLDMIYMEDSDYNRMDVDIGNTVMIDFGTVGKDLGTCFYTDDVELVKRKEIKQQDYIRPFLSFKWTQDTRSKLHEYQNYYKWCSDNNVYSYGYDVTLDKYNLGRVIIGDLIGKETFTVADIQTILEEYPHFVDIVLTEEPYTG